MSSLEYKLENKIMATDLYVGLSSDTIPIDYLQAEIFRIEAELIEFEHRYSRFIDGNLLDKFNRSTDIELEVEFYDILKLCEHFFNLTDGLFDPTIHKDLISEGYNVSKNAGFYNSGLSPDMRVRNYDFSSINFTTKNSISKPGDVTIDLGGIGKSYILAKISKNLRKKYRNFCISLGGDMVLSGKDIKNNYDYWAIEVEPPSEYLLETPTLLLSDISVATSGTYKRNWNINKAQNNHIIDPRTNSSTRSEIISSTVIASDLVYADTMAKVLILMGEKLATEYVATNNIAAVFINNSNQVKISSEAQKYVWK